MVNTWHLGESIALSNPLSQAMNPQMLQCRWSTVNRVGCDCYGNFQVLPCLTVCSTVLMKKALTHSAPIMYNWKSFNQRCISYHTQTLWAACELHLPMCISFHYPFSRQSKLKQNGSASWPRAAMGMIRPLSLCTLLRTGCRSRTFLPLVHKQTESSDPTS